MTTETRYDLRADPMLTPHGALLPREVLITGTFEELEAWVEARRRNHGDRQVFYAIETGRPNARGSVVWRWYPN